jgi:hypothetical protein
MDMTAGTLTQAQTQYQDTIAVATMSTIERIPFDVLWHITQELDFPSVLALTQTNRRLHASLDPYALASHAAKRRFFWRADRFPQNADKLACFHCWRMRPAGCFGRSERKGRKGRNGFLAEPSAKRFCWDCAAEKRLYREGTPVCKDGFRWYLCHTCGRFNTKSQRCEKVVREDGSTETRCFVAPEPAPSAFERLPDVLQQKIFANLEYTAALRLAQTNKHFHRLVDPQECSLVDKVQFAFGRPSGGRICYACYKVKPDERFYWNQVTLDAKKLHRRRCKPCLTLHATPTDAGRAAKARWEAEQEAWRWCWMCNTVVLTSAYEGPEKCCVPCVKKNNLVEEREKVRRLRRQRRDQENGRTRAWHRASEPVPDGGFLALLQPVNTLEESPGAQTVLPLSARQVTLREVVETPVPESRPASVDQPAHDNDIEMFDFFQQLAPSPSDDASQKMMDESTTPASVGDSEDDVYVDADMALDLLVPWMQEVEEWSGRVETALEDWRAELRIREEETRTRYQGRFQNGNMSAAEASLYRRLLDGIRGRRQRQPNRHSGHGIFGQFRQRVRTLVLGGPA